ncbi:hypothetical protein [Dyella subtropica]|uniref:hypothetical protein n=1 Tax=Dyella subtropica TaxID=2992127 RepID=UPI002255B057|nr:hypothetical protein [Dyella subtropica]
MNQNRKYRNLIIATIAIAAMGPPIARAQNAPPVASAPASTTAANVRDPVALSDQRHWQSFLKLAAKPNAVVTVEDLEGAFQEKSVHRKNPGFPDSYKIQNFVEIAFGSNRLGLTLHYPERGSNFTFYEFLPPRPNDNPWIDTKPCIAHEQAMRDLQRAGWVLHTHSPGEPIHGDIREQIPPGMPLGWYTLIKGDQGVLTLVYSEPTHCADRIIMQSDKFEFNRVTRAATPEGGQ